MMRGLLIPVAILVAMVRDEMAVVVDDDPVLVVVCGVHHLSERRRFLHGTTRVMGTALETLLVELSLDRRMRTAIPSS